MARQYRPQSMIGGVNAALFFIFWLLVLLAGADFPPPRGFLWMVLTVALCAGVVYWRVPSYVAWQRTRRAGRYWRVVCDGLIAGLLVALPFVLLGGGEPSVTVRPVDYGIWFAVLASMGLVNAAALYAINALVAHKMKAARKIKMDG
ncbi:MAG: hypothetical protein KDD78_14610 [Caldilineaceae bacterium]|nr:hypothetical protein [Caldilineaceae bacterium]